MDVIDMARNVIYSTELAVEDAVADMFGEEGAEEAPTDDMFRDMLVAVIMTEDTPDEVAREACRMSLGYVPHELVGRLGQVEQEW